MRVGACSMTSVVLLVVVLPLVTPGLAIALLWRRAVRWTALAHLAAWSANRARALTESSSEKRMYG